MRIVAYFFDSPGSDLDKACRAIFEAREGARSIGSGTFLVGERAGERDVEYDVPDHLAAETQQALKDAGFRCEAMS
jgi:hypothetical protein